MPLFKRPRKAFIEKRAKFKAMADAGVKYSEIEKTIGIPHSTAMLWRNEYGIPEREGGRPKVWRPPVCPDCDAEMQRVDGTRTLWECQCAKEHAPAKFEAVANG